MAGITKHKTKQRTTSPRQSLSSRASVCLLTSLCVYIAFFPVTLSRDSGALVPSATNLRQVRTPPEQASLNHHWTALPTKRVKKIGTCGVYICRSKPERLAKGWMRFHQTAQVEGDGSQKHIQPRGMISTLSDITSSSLSSRQPRTRWNSSSRHHHKWSQEAQFAVLARHRPLPSMKSVGEWDAVFGPPFGL